MKKVFAIAFTLLLLAACKNSSHNGMGSATSWLDGDRSSTQGDQTNAVNVVFFGYDSSSVDGTARTKVQEQADLWKASQNMPVLIVEGHCDQRGTIDYNLALGERRAYAVKKELIKFGVPAHKIETISFGKERPAVMDDDAHSLSLNRRAVTIAIKDSESN